ncbi:MULTISPECIES: hypothetical protein [unclassified Polaribacter]|nr:MULTISPECIES: hypothetical protein [unclassified Polaribacter]
MQSNFGYLFREYLIAEIAKVGIHKTFTAETAIIEICDSIKSMPIIL